MGLLDRVQILGNRIVPENNNSTIPSFRHNPESLDYPGAVFEDLQSRTGFKKGALLFLDQKGREYYPWISAGFDRTTSRRLRIPAHFPVLNSNTSYLLPINPKDFSPMLSNRELGMMKNLTIIKLGKQNPASSLLLVSDLPDAQISNEKTAVLQALCEEFGEGIEKSRRFLNQSDEVEIINLTEWFNSWGTGKAVLVTLDISSAINSFIDSVKGLELYRARKDTVSLIRHLTGRMGRLHDLKGERVLILFPRERLPDYELYLHHLSNSFSSFFNNLSHPPQFPADFNLWPEDRKTIEENLSGFF